MTTRAMKVEFFKHALSEADIARVDQVLRSVFLTTGPVAAEFEGKFASYTGMAHAVCLNSCTSALHLGLLAAGIGPGDEVITTPMTFIATATAILHTGATLVFADVEADTGLIDPANVEAKLTPRTKAIVPVHLYGTMADMSALRVLADRYGLRIIEDAAHCIEGERDGYRPGELSDAACYSFYATKNMTCGEGGALATNDRSLAQKVRTLRQHGMSREAADRYHGLYQHWDMVALGWKCNLDDIHAALLIDQMERLDAQWQRRHDLHALYCRLLQGNEAMSWPAIRGRSAHHLFTLWVAPEYRDALLSGLGLRGVGVAVNYRAIHVLQWFRENFGYTPQDFPNAWRIGCRTLSLPFYPDLITSEVEWTVKQVRTVLDELRC